MSGENDTELRSFGRKWYIYDGERSRIVAGPFPHRNAAREWSAQLFSPACAAQFRGAVVRGSRR
jgi:hypothetical protein